MTYKRVMRDGRIIYSDPTPEPSLKKKEFPVIPQPEPEKKSVAQRERELTRMNENYDDRLALAQARISHRARVVRRTGVGAALSIPVIIAGAATVVYVSIFIGIVIMLIGAFFLIGNVVARSNMIGFGEGKDEDGFFKDPLKEVQYCKSQKRDITHKLEDLYLEEQGKL